MNTNGHNDVRRLPPDIRAIEMEGRCVHDHAQMRAGRGWKFCPWCGKSLVVFAYCDHCGKHFISEKAFAVHLKDLSFLKGNKCEVDERHPVQYQKRRGKMYCPTCKVEWWPRGKETVAK